MLRLDARKVVRGLACVVSAGVITLTLVACGSGSSGDTQRSASEHPPPADWELREGARKREAKERQQREDRLVRVAFAQAHQVQRCISRSGYTTVADMSHNGPRSLGAVPVMRATRVEYGGRLPVAQTGLRTDHGFYYVGIAPTRGLAHLYYEFESGVVGASERDHSYDGLVSMESVHFGKSLATYAADLRMVASCAFSFPAAPGKPKWTFSAESSPIVRAVAGR